MNVIVKILIAAIITLGLTSLSLWGFQLISGTSDLPWRILLSSSFGVLAALMVLLSVSIVIIYDVVSIFSFRFGLEHLNGEIDFYAGPEGAVPRKLSTRGKLTNYYPFLFFSIQLIISMICKNSVT